MSEVVKCGATRSTFGHINDTSWVTDTLPASTVAANDLLEIVCTGALTVQIFLEVFGQFYATFAESKSEAHTRLSSDNTRGTHSAGFFSLPVGSQSTKNLYLKSTGAAVSSPGVSYHLVEED